MNNCPKCGNPLQSGTTKCPICGTDIIATQTVAPATAAPAAPASTQVVQTPAAQPVAAPVTQTIEAATTAPTVQAVTTASPVTSAPAQVTVAAPSEAAAPVTAIAPTVERVESPTPVPGIPSSIATPAMTINTEEPLVINPKLVPKKKNKKTPIILAAALVVVLGIGCFMAFKPSKTASSNTNTATEELSMGVVSSNGYNLKLAEGWETEEDGTNVIIFNTDETVAMKLEHYKANLANTDLNGIESIVKSYNSFQDVTASNTDVSGKNSYLVTANINDLPVQIYFINGGNNLIIGATIVYQSNDTKDKYEATVTEMIGTLSYSDNSIKALDSINKYSDAFGIFGGVASKIGTTSEVTTTETETSIEDNTIVEDQNAEPNTTEDQDVTENGQNTDAENQTENIEE